MSGTNKVVLLVSHAHKRIYAFSAMPEKVIKLVAARHRDVGKCFMAMYVNMDAEEQSKAKHVKAAHILAKDFVRCMSMCEDELVVFGSYSKEIENYRVAGSVVPGDKEIGQTLAAWLHKYEKVERIVKPDTSNLDAMLEALRRGAPDGTYHFRRSR